MNKKLLISSALLCFLTAPTFAQSIPYVGIDGGLVTLSSGVIAMFNPLINQSGLNGRIRAGNLWGDPQSFQYGVEAAAMYFPHASYKVLDLVGVDVAYKGYSLSMLGVGKYNFSQKYFLIGKAGVAYVYEKNQDTFELADDPTPFSQASGHRVAPEAALGVGRAFTPNLTGEIMVDSIFAGRPYGHSSNPVTQTNTIDIGLTYYFA